MLRLDNYWTPAEDINGELTMRDSLTGKIYFSDGKRRFFALEATLGMIPHAIAVVTAFVYKIFLVLSFHSFWREGKQQALSGRFIEWFDECSKVVFAPLAIPALFLTAVYGIYNDKHGRKIHSAMETIFYGHPMIALCMHPQPPVERLFENKLRKIQVMIIKILLVHPFKIIIAAFYHAAPIISFKAFWSTSAIREEVKIGNWFKDVGNLVMLIAVIPIILFAVFLTLVSKEKGQAFYRKVEDALYGQDLSRRFARIEVFPLEAHTHFDRWISHN